MRLPMSSGVIPLCTLLNSIQSGHRWRENDCENTKCKILPTSNLNANLNLSLDNFWYCNCEVLFARFSWGPTVLNCSSSIWLSVSSRSLVSCKEFLPSKLLVKSLLFIFLLTGPVTEQDYISMLMSSPLFQQINELQEMLDKQSGFGSSHVTGM